jgi:glutamate dehydrogenase
MLVRFVFPSSGTLFSDKTADCGWVFAQHFCNRLGASYLALKNVLNEANPAHEEVLMDIKRRFREETFTRESIANVIHAHPELVRRQNLSHFFYGMLISKDRSVCFT